jgi:imidazolonepropionase
LSGAEVPRRRATLAVLGTIHDGAVLAKGPEILRVGKTADLEADARRLRAEAIDCCGRVVMPGFVDSHTHLIFAGNRVEDFEQRIQGRTYQEIARAGGGIRSSAERLKQAPRAELVARGLSFLEQFTAHGTTTVEVKTGYGLDVPGELKSLGVLRGLQKISPLELVPTLLVAHALPAEYAKRRQAYLKLILRKLIPTAAGKKRAEFIDCFCDRAAFSVEECRKLLRAGQRRGLVPRLHADQLSRAGAARLAIELGAASADHVDWLSSSDVGALARSSVVATLLPGSNFHLHLRYSAPARRLIEAGAVVALATDFNPGTSPTLNMQFVLSLACSVMGMTPAEAISAATINAAYSLRRAGRIGSLEPGKLADLAVMNVDDYREIPYYFAWNHCVMTVKRGKIIYSRQ